MFCGSAGGWSHDAALVVVLLFALVDETLQLEPRELAWSKFSEADINKGPKSGISPAAAIDEGLSDRRLQSHLSFCSSHSDCGVNEYCYDCEKCHKYHNSLSALEQLGWTCDPCDENGGGYCVSGRFCRVANDPITEPCPVFLGCNSHNECKADEYCFGCNNCSEILKQADRFTEFEQICSPCGHITHDGFCKAEQLCDAAGDAIDGKCPEPFGCSSHQNCSGETYCEGCEACLAYQQSLPEEQRLYWGCYCPTQGGGFCEALRWCSIADDGIDGSCPQAPGCDSHAQCQPSEYCYSCEACATYHNSLPEHEQELWRCDPCPTLRGGSCGYREFCREAGDSINGTCPPASSCVSHAGCGPDEYCMSHEACVTEMGPYWCGPSTTDGVCHLMEECTPSRSINGLCNMARPCEGHEACATGQFCTSRAECEQRTPGQCGSAETRLSGVCLPLSHCVRGLHAPVDGSCPLHKLDRGELVLDEALQLQHPIVLATRHQGLGSWLQQGKEHVLVQLHDYQAGSSGLDDVESLGIYAKQASSDGLERIHNEQLSCPSVALAVPPNGPYVYEARIHMSEFEMSTSHPECSCIDGDDGACPRGAKWGVTGGQSGNSEGVIEQLHVAGFVHATTGNYLANALTPYSMKEDATPAWQVTMVNSRLATEGGGIREQGCPDVGIPASDVPPLSDPYWQTRTLPEGHVTGKWCAVEAGGCSFTAKYKFCLQGKAQGVIFIAEAPDASQPNHAVEPAQIFLHPSEQISEMIPVVYIPFNAAFVSAIRAPAEGSQVTFQVGRSIGGALPSGFVPSPGGVRVFDTMAKEWTEHSDCCFKTQEWMYHSPARPVLFACTHERSIVAIDTSNPKAGLPTLGGPSSRDVAPCQASERMRDSSIVDFKHVTGFLTIVIDPSDAASVIHAFGTNSLNDWKHMDSLKFDNNLYLGQVAASASGDLLIVTFMCSVVYCQDADSTLQRPGERIEVYDILPDFLTGKILHNRVGVVDLPMSRGSMVRDVKCTALEVCFISMTYDGVAALDVRRGSPTFARIVAHHSETFHTEHTSDLLISRMLSGAQKVVPSASSSNSFYVEGWSFDEECFEGGGSTQDCIRYDRLWRGHLEGHFRNENQAGGSLPVDPPIDARLIISCPPETFVQIMLARSLATELQIGHALASAVLVTSSRFSNIHVIQEESFSSVIITFTILGGTAPPSPEMIFIMLRTQLATPGSAVLSGSLGDVLEYGAYLEHSSGVPVEHETKGTSFSNTAWWATLLIFLNVLIFFVAILFAWSQRKQAQTFMALIAQQRQFRQDVQDQQPSFVAAAAARGGGPRAAEAEVPFLGAGAGGGLRMAASDHDYSMSGAVIGRPDLAGGAPDGTGQAPPAADMAYVVGRPVSQNTAATGSSTGKKIPDDSSDDGEDVSGRGGDV